MGGKHFTRHNDKVSGTIKCSIKGKVYTLYEVDITAHQKKALVKLHDNATCDKGMNGSAPVNIGGNTKDLYKLFKGMIDRLENILTEEGDNA